MSWVRCAFSNLNIVCPELATLSYFHRKPGNFDLRWNIGWRFWAFVLRRIFGNSWRCQIHPVTFYMTRMGAEKLQMQHSYKTHGILKTNDLLHQQSQSLWKNYFKSQKVKDLSNTVISKCWPLILGVWGGSIRNMALYLLSCQWAKSRRLTSVWIFTHVTQPGSFTVFTTAFPWLQSTPQQKNLCHGLTRQRIFSPGIFMTVNTLKRGRTKSNR